MHTFFLESFYLNNKSVYILFGDLRFRKESNLTLQGNIPRIYILVNAMRYVLLSTMIG